MDTAHPLDTLPGHMIRRLHQISLGLYHQNVQDLDLHLTPVQYAVLHTLQAHPGIDQRTLARWVALDTSTAAGVVERLEARGLLTRQRSAHDKRVRLLSLSPNGHALLAQTIPRVLDAQQRLLAPLAPADRRHFVELLQQLVQGNADHSRVPV